MSKIGEQIKTARITQNLSQNALAKLMHVKSGSVISYWERGQNEPSSTHRATLCDALGVTPSYLLDYAGDDFVLSPLEREHIKKYRRLSPEGQRAVDMVLNNEVRRSSPEADETLLGW